MDLGITLDDALIKASPILREKMERSIQLIRKAEKLSLMYDDTDGFFLLLVVARIHKRYIISHSWLA